MSYFVYYHANNKDGVGYCKFGLGTAANLTSYTQHNPQIGKKNLIELRQSSKEKKSKDTKEYGQMIREEMVEARFRRFGLNDEWFHLSGRDMETLKAFVDAAVRGKQFLEKDDFETLILNIREMEPSQPEGILTPSIMEQMEERVMSLLNIERPLVKTANNRSTGFSIDRLNTTRNKSNADLVSSSSKLPDLPSMPSTLSAIPSPLLQD